ncbi:hypothetical protein GCM10009836_63570 [Pseudonocardia ailaonensis]|uniref:Short chain dehydrogenase n=1 Tax=Pseudonocardia ailaonensis TaxID=367279 RepID=A0ABN2NL02_9PSEU
MSTDRFRDFSNGSIAKRLGVPRIPVLRRYAPGQPLLDGPALVAGAGRFAKAVSALLAEENVPVVEAAEAEPAGPTVGRGEERLAAVVVDLTGATTLDDLAAAREILQSAVRKLAPSGRVLLLGPDASQAASRAGSASAGVEAAAVAQALDGLVRTIAKELRAGATANLLVVDADAVPAAVDSSVRFFLSARSAYVDGQVVHIGVPVGAPQDPPAVDSPTERRLEGRIAVVTGAARGSAPP